MINKFLYDIDGKGKRVLFGLLEDEADGKIELGSEIDYSFQGDYDQLDISRNLGGQCYVVFDDNGVKKYLDIDFYKDKAKIQLTDKIAYAFPISEDLIDVILDYLDVDLEYEVIYGCFYEHPKKGTVDILEKQFKGLFTDSYVQVINEGVSYFLGKTDDYILTRNLREAKKFHKSEIRKILIINKFVDRSTDIKQLYFSPYQLLRGEEEFFLLNPSPLMISKVEDNFIVKTTNIAITNKHLLCKSELINGKMKEIHSLLNKEEELEKGYAIAYSKYLEVKDNIFTLNTNPSKKSLVSKTCISLFSSIYSIFSESEVFYVKEQNLVNIYETEEDKYKLTQDNIDTYLSTNIVKENVYYDFLKAFITTKVNNLDKGFILSINDKYLSIELFENNEFKIIYNDSSYNATVFNELQAKVLSKIIRKDIIRREFNNLLKDPKKYNFITKETSFNLEKEYTNILNDIVKNKYKMDMYNNSVVKLESEKGALEYLRRFFPKSINDSEILFENILSTTNISNILLVESLVNIDLIALNNICVKLNKKVNVSLINTSKIGYYPKTNLSNINVKEIYRMEFCSMPKVFLEKFDLILFSRGFQQQSLTFNNIILDIINSQDTIFANIKACNLDKNVDSFSNVFNKIKRKYFKELPNSDKYVELSRQMLEENELSGFNGIFAIDPIVEKEFSYHSIVVVKNNKVYDFYK